MRLSDLRTLDDSRIRLAIHPVIDDFTQFNKNGRTSEGAADVDFFCEV